MKMAYFRRTLCTNVIAVCWCLMAWGIGLQIFERRRQMIKKRPEGRFMISRSV